MALKVWLPLDSDITTNNGLFGDIVGSLETNSDTAPTATYGVGILGGQSLAFNGENYCLSFNCANHFTSVPTEFSISFWVKEGVSVATNDVLLSIVAGGTESFVIKKQSEDYVASGLASGTLFTLGSGWNHVIITVDGSNIKAYVDGVLDQTLAQASNIANKDFKVYFGGTYGQEVEVSWKGSISNVKFYDHILSLFDIISESNGLVLNYSFNGNVSLGSGVSLPSGVTAAMMGFGDKEHDLSGNEYDGTYGTIRPTASNDTAVNSSSLDFTEADAVTSPVINTTDLSSRCSVSVWVKGEGTIASFSGGNSIATIDAASEWHNIVFTSASKKYVDGVEVNGGLNPLGSGVANCTITIGGSFTGKIADFRVYAKQFTADEVLALYKRKAAIDNTGKLIASEIVVTDDTDTPSFSKQGVVSAAALESWTGEYQGENTVPVDVTTFKILQSTNTIEATDVIEF